jgi:PAS domain S-box-containing protein
MVVAREVVRFASDAALAIDAAYRVVAWNQPAANLLGYSAKEAVGRKCAAVLQAVLPHGEPLCSAGCAASLCFGRCLPFASQSCRVRHKDGTWITLSISTLVVPKSGRAKKAESAIAAIIFLRPHVDAGTDRAPEQEPIRVFTLGHFGLAFGARGIAVEKWQRKQAVTLLKYLIIRIGVAVHREELIDCLWPDSDPDQGRDRLKVTVYFLRRQLRAAGVDRDVVETQKDGYLLRRDAIWVDAETFEQLTEEGTELHRQGKGDDALACFEDAQRLYRGDYMAEDPYADWCAEERERLRELFLDMSTTMARACAQRGRYADAAQICRKALVREPCRESLHRALMEYFVRSGRPDWAAAQYRRCKRILEDELGVAPMAETQRLYESILADAAARARQPAKVMAT